MRASELAVAGPAGTLDACLLEPAVARWRAVVAHPHPLYGGTMDNAVVRLTTARLAAAGAVVLAFDFRGVRRSEGTHDGGRGERLDLLAAERELERRHPGLPHWLAGYSFGAATCVGRLGACSLRTAPVAGLGEAADEPDAPRSGSPHALLDSVPEPGPPVDALLLLAPPLAHHELADADGATMPVALITGERDPLTPEAALRRFCGRLSSLRTHQRLAGAGHDLGTADAPVPPALSAALDRAIAELAAARRPAPYSELPEPT